MKKLLFACCLSFSIMAFSQDEKSAAETADLPTGTIVPPTTKQLKSVKKPKKATEAKPEVPKTETTTPTSTPSH